MLRICRFGKNQSTGTSYLCTDMVEFIDNFAALGLKKFFLMGHSFGGGIAVHYALAHPQRILKLVLVSSLCLGTEIALWVRLFSNPMVCRAMGKAAISLFKVIKYIAKFFGPWEIVEPVTKASIQIGGYIATFTTQTIVLISQLPEIMVPTLVMWGARDAIVPSSQAYNAGQLIPNCRVKVFEGCGHSVYRDRLRDFSKELMRFLG